MSRFYGEKDPEHCKVQWIPLIHNIHHESKCFNWADIVSQNIAKALKLSLLSPPGYKQMFCMSILLMDIVSAIVPFPLMKWNYLVDQQLPIRNYAPILWESNFKFHLYDIFHYVMIPLHIILFGKAPPRPSESLKEALESIHHWFVE